MDVFHRIYTFKDARALRGIPMGLATGGKMIKDVAKGELLTENDFVPDTSRLAYKLRQLQNVMLAEEENE